MVGTLMLAGAFAQDATLGELVLGGMVFPGILLGWQWGRTRRDQRAIRAIGPAAHLLTLLVFLVLYSTPQYAPSLSVTSGAALIFFGGSMLVAAVRGYRGCEVLAVSNWILGRNDQVGCVLFSPIDHLEGAEATR